MENLKIIVEVVGCFIPYIFLCFPFHLPSLLIHLPTFLTQAAQHFPFPVLLMKFNPSLISDGNSVSAGAC